MVQQRYHIELAETSNKFSTNLSFYLEFGSSLTERIVEVDSIPTDITIYAYVGSSEVPLIRANETQPTDKPIGRRKQFSKEKLQKLKRF